MVTVPAIGRRKNDRNHREARRPGPCGRDPAVGPAAGIGRGPQYYPRRHYGGQAIAGGVIGGVIGGLAAGAIIQSTRPHYYPPVEASEPVYAAPPEPVYVPTCHIVRRKVWLDPYAPTPTGAKGFCD